MYVTLPLQRFMMPLVDCALIITVDFISKWSYCFNLNCIYYNVAVRYEVKCLLMWFQVKPQFKSHDCLNWNQNFILIYVDKLRVMPKYLWITYNLWEYEVVKIFKIYMNRNFLGVNIKWTRILWWVAVICLEVISDTLDVQVFQNSLTHYRWD
jgi:hypothetical protein